MKIDLTPEARTQAELIRDMNTVENGFLMGTVMGKHIIIEALFPVNFNEKTISDAYRTMLDKNGDRVMGVFFNNREPFLSEWFLEDVIMTIDAETQRWESYIYEFEEKNLATKTLSHKDTQRKNSFDK